MPIVSIDLDPVAPGVKDSLSVDMGDSFTVDLFFGSPVPFETAAGLVTVVDPFEPVPEPSILAVIAPGLAGLRLNRRRKPLNWTRHAPERRSPTAPMHPAARPTATMWHHRWP